MSLELFYKVPAGAIETLVDAKNKAWFKRTDLGRYLDIKNIRDNFKDLVNKTLTRKQLVSVGGSDPLGKGKNNTDCFVSFDGALEIAVRSRKHRAVALVKWLTRKGVEKINEEHQQAIKAKKQQLALIHGAVRQLRFNNVGLQGEIRAKDQEIATLYDRHVPNAQDPGKDNIVIIIRKNTEPENDEFFEYPYYIARIQRRYEASKRRFFDANFPNHETILNAVDNANSVHVFNRFEENTHVERHQCHFRLVDILEDVLRALIA